MNDASIVKVLREAEKAIEQLIAEKPMLAAKRCGSTTLGNLLAQVRALTRAVEDACDGMCGWSHTHCTGCRAEIVDYAQGGICVECTKKGTRT